MIFASSYKSDCGLVFDPGATIYIGVGLIGERVFVYRPAGIVSEGVIK
jgi:hypothetical protein